MAGAGQAGTAAALALRQGGWLGPITLIGEEALLPYERPPLSKAVLVEQSDPGPRPIVTPEELARLSITCLQGCKVISIDRAAHTVTLSQGTRMRYERLLLATGAIPRRLTIPIAEGSAVTTLRTYADAMTIRRVAEKGYKIVVIGGGFIGLEVAASAAAKGALVTVIESGPRLLTRAVPGSIAELIRAKHERAGVGIETGVTIERIDKVEGRSQLRLTNGRTHRADLVVVGIGAVPNVELARAAELDVDNGIAVDEMLVTSDPDILAAGDCCSFPHPVFGERMRLEAWRNAQRQGAVAAANILGGKRPYEDVPWFWSDQFDETLQMAGMYREEHVPVVRKLSGKGEIVFYLASDGRLVAACGFGSLGAIAKEIRFAEMLIGRRLAPSPEALADPKVNIKSLLV